MHKERPDTRGLRSGIEGLVDEAVSVGGSLGKNIGETLRGVLLKRESVVMVRMNKESAARLDELIDAGLVSSRSGAAAFLIGEGIKARRDFFVRISEKVQQIRNAREELQTLLEEPMGEERSPSAGDSDESGEV